MLQAEIAGRTIPSCDGYQSVGHIMRDFQLCSSEGRSVLLSDYREHTNMVLVFTSESRLSTDLLSELEGHRPNLAKKETSVQVIVPGSQRSSELERALGSEILVDVDGRVHRSKAADGRLTSREYSAGLVSSIVNVPNAAPLERPD
jgi:hypothetical protein